MAERHFKRTDPGQVVLDEVLGMQITLFLNPVGWTGALIGFLLFDEVPDIWSWIGGTVIFVNAVYITFHEAGARTDKPPVAPA